MSYDSKCHDLAAHFLADEPMSDPLDAAELAQVIQTAIEDWLAFQMTARYAAAAVPE